MKKYNVIGLMSGTSQDGLDIAYCTFTNKGGIKWSYEIVKAETVKYKEEIKNYFTVLEQSDAATLALADMEFGGYLGIEVKKFIKKHKLKPQLVASHGHTIFHRPESRYTFQLGSGAAIAAECKLPVVCDFRTLDVALGGQGAPLVPIGDKLLFANYDYCLNLGGFANISFDKNKKRIAFDVCPVNIVLNELAAKKGVEYDDKGNMAREGNINEAMLSELNKFAFYKIKIGKPKSLGKEWVIENIQPLLDKYSLSVNDALATFVEHIAQQTANVIKGKSTSEILVTGGGAFNEFLIQRIKANSKYNFIIPDSTLVNFKEALIFAFLGVLRFRNEINTLKSVTGASRDSSGGCIYNS